MVQCEMCGAETGSPKTIKVEGAELDVCDNCSNLGTEVSQPSSDQSTSSKYSTSSSPSASGGPSQSTATSTSSQTGGTSSSGQNRSRGGDDMFDTLGEIAADYDERIRAARESRGLSQEELAKELNEKRSLISKLERADILPSDAIQSKLERFLEIDLTEEAEESEEWSGAEGDQSFTLGEMAERRE